MTKPPLHIRILLFGVICGLIGEIYGIVDLDTWYYELFGALLMTLWIIAAWTLFFTKELKTEWFTEAKQ